MSLSAQGSRAGQASRRLGVVGIGAIGGSFALAVREAGLFDELLGFDTGVGALDRALALGIVDRGCESVAELAALSQVVLVSVPVSRAAACVAESLAAGSGLVMDVGSVKRSLFDALGDQDLSRLVAVHPIAGTHLSGPDAARPDMFCGAPLVIISRGEHEARSQAQDLWSACGALCFEMDSDVHDRLVALTSHLPHLLAFCFMRVVGREQAELLRPLLGPGFRDFTRIAQGDAHMWQSIFSENREELLELIDGFTEKLEGLKDALESPEALRELLSEASRSLRMLR